MESYEVLWWHLSGSEGMMTSPFHKIIAIVGTSGSGKTTLLEGLIPLLVKRGLRVGTIKHDVHGFDMDKPGKDSWRHKRAGSAVSLISSPNKIGLVMDTDHDWTINELGGFFPHVDLILAEGYKKEEMPKIEVLRPGIRDTPLCTSDKNLLAIFSDMHLDVKVPVFKTTQIDELADFIIEHFDL